MDVTKFMQYVKCFNDNDYDQMITYYAPEVIYHCSPTLVIKGPEAIKAHYSKLHESFQDSLEIPWIAVDNGKVALEVAESWVCTNPQGATYGNGDDTSKRYAHGERGSMTFFAHYNTRADGKIVEIKLAYV